MVASQLTSKRRKRRRWNQAERAALQSTGSMTPAHPARLALSDLLRDVSADDALARRSTETDAE